MIELLHLCMGVTNKCVNPDSYGCICVRCNRCGRFDKLQKVVEAYIGPPVKPKTAQKTTKEAAE